MKKRLTAETAEKTVRSVRLQADSLVAQYVVSAFRRTVVGSGSSRTPRTGAHGPAKAGHYVLRRAAMYCAYEGQYVVSAFKAQAKCELAHFQADDDWTFVQGRATN